MWEYTDKVRDHFLNPRNVGDLKDANAVAEVGNLSCGDAMKLMLKINEQEIIEDVKFQTFGCASAIASASMLSEIIKGMPLAEAMKITNQDIVDRLEGLPPQKIHCSVMCEEALEKAAQNYYGIQPEESSDDSPIICRCFHITENKLRKTIRENMLRTLEEVTDYTKAGGACGACKTDIQKILDEELGTRDEKNYEADGSTNLERIDHIKKTIFEVIRPALEHDGGGIELIDITGHTVKVHLTGACHACERAEYTLKNFVQEKLRELADPKIEVEAV